MATEDWMQPYFEAYKVVHHLDYLKVLNDKFSHGVNKIHHMREVAGATSPIVTPSFDQLYSVAIIDIRLEPQIIHGPQVEGRYSSLQLTDMEGGTICYALRQEHDIIVMADSYEGPIPEGQLQVVRSHSDFVHMCVRTQLFDTADIANVHKLQDGWTVRGLTARDNLPFDPPSNESHWQEKAAFAYKHSRRFEINKALIDSVASLNDPDGSKYQQAIQFMDEKAKGGDGIRDSTGLFEAIDDPNGSRDVLRRAMAVRLGHLGLPRSASYYEMISTKKDGTALVGDTPLILNLPYEPGVTDFWSVTLYDSATRLPLANKLNVYNAFNTKPDKNGLVTISVSNVDPVDTSYWLPAPEGLYYLICRYYAPTDKLFQGNNAQSRMP